MSTTKGVLDLTFLDLNQFESGLLIQIQQQQQLSKLNAASDIPVSSPTSSKANDIVNANKLYINEDLDKLLTEKFQDTLSNDKIKNNTNHHLFGTFSAADTNTNTESFNATSSSNNKTTANKSPKSCRNYVKAIRLSNNNLKYAEFIIYSLIRLNLIEPYEVLWIDLSFNMLEFVPSNTFLQLFPNITNIYLQANKINNLSSTKVFHQLKHLKTISLFGNPIEEMKHYRNFILYQCPTIIQLDGVVVTKSDRVKLESWQQTFRKKLHPET